MKKSILYCLLLCFFCLKTEVALLAQIKVHPDPQNLASVSLGTLASPPPTSRVMITAQQRKIALLINAIHQQDGDRTMLTITNQPRSASYVVRYIGRDNFLVHGDGQVKAVNYWQTSDKDLKTDIGSIEQPLARLLQLQGRSFRLKPVPACEGCDSMISYPLQIGFIAQEVEKIVPELVGKMQDGKKALQYGNMTALIVEAMKAQQKRIEVLENELDLMRKYGHSRRLMRRHSKNR